MRWIKPKRPNTEEMELIRQEYGEQLVYLVGLIFCDTSMECWRYECVLDCIRDYQQRSKDGSDCWSSASWNDLPIHFRYRLFFTDFLFDPTKFKFSDN